MWSVTCHVFPLARLTHNQQQREELKPDTSAFASGSLNLLNFLKPYPNPLSRFTSTPAPSTSSSSTSSRRPSKGHHSPPGALAMHDSSAVEGPRVATTPSATLTLYPLSTIVIVALISFLLGSLLRALLSPADF